MRQYRNHIVFGLLFGFLVSCAKEVALPIDPNFDIEVVDHDYSVPVYVKINNQTEGADTFQWTFDGGEPATSTDKNPGTILYNRAGNFTISLKASNRDGTQETKSMGLSIDEAIVPNFKINVEGDDFAPVTITIENTTKGATTFDWTFAGGIPQKFDARTPGKIVFQESGDHVITLEAGNGRETHTITDTVVVASGVSADFEMEPAFEDDDFQAPVTLNLINNSTSAIGYEWTFEAADLSNSTEINPTVTFHTPGVHQIKLKAYNNKRSSTKIKEVTIYENTNLRVLENIELGISTAHNSNQVGAFFSTTTREVYKADEIAPDDASFIDIAFFALNQDFNFNKFVSPDEVQDYTFGPIPNAKHTKFINLQESCECEATLTVAEFDVMEDDSLLAVLNIEETIGGIQDFDNSVLPRIVLFETWDGRKGAIKIKEFVQDGTNSHIVVDVKVQKQ
ncbi:PKD domain-containing protein [Muricauda sp. 334s03]|uniref:PKD domain-containing protein n=1 Tax=Flagellimonas yonaguniensis TaxID=3031325 RepID=A0ABT5XZ75_9FLAO|nr:PKD domain-containing protein [[Muricauda] yonaguniensis]MDF0716495.1 PKD domain-containing protein [[Muricauda] yonaguniensis]